MVNWELVGDTITVIGTVVTWVGSVYLFVWLWYVMADWRRARRQDSFPPRPGKPEVRVIRTLADACFVAGVAESDVFGIGVHTLMTSPGRNDGFVIPTEGCGIEIWCNVDLMTDGDVVTVSGPCSLGFLRRVGFDRGSFIPMRPELARLAQVKG